MSKKKLKKIGFNLLRMQLAQEDKWDKIYNWISNTARIIVMLTELVVVVVFAVRVVVDRSARDLTKKLDDNQFQLDALKSSELEIKKIQSNLTIYSNLWINSTKFSDAIREVYSYNGALNPFISVTVNEIGEVEITGSTNEVSMATLESDMKNSSTFGDVELVTYRSKGQDETGSGQFQIIGKIIDIKRDPLGSGG